MTKIRAAILVCILPMVAVSCQQSPDGEKSIPLSDEEPYTELLQNRESVYPIAIDLDHACERYDSPEHTVCTVLTAIYQGNEQRYRSAHTGESLQTLQEANEQLGYTFSTWHEIDQTTLEIHLMDEWVYEDVVFVHVRKIIEPDSSNTEPRIMNFPLSLVVENGKWKITQKFAGDPRTHDLVSKINPTLPPSRPGLAPVPHQDQ